MFASGILHSKIAESSHRLLIPKSSILWTGKRAVVYVKVPGRDSPSFVYREITLGPEAGNFYVVAEGLVEGEMIAVNGVFKIDAAAQLEGKPSMMNPGGSNVSVEHDHGSMSEASMTPEPETAGATDHSGPHPPESNPVADVVNEKFKEQLRKVYESYIQMTAAFVASDPEEVSKQARSVGANLQKTDMSLLAGDTHREWMTRLGRLNEDIKKIENSRDIAEQRVLYAAFNNTFYSSLKTFGLPRGTIYYQYCPMANGEEGAYWFSNEKEISNPYFGDAMLRCGETKETMEF
jgi:Cu(I)/Ag(I) efflux system membrane fusion protein